jgi:hypothetical protein
MFPALDPEDALPEALLVPLETTFDFPDAATGFSIETIGALAGMANSLGKSDSKT